MTNEADQEFSRLLSEYLAGYHDDNPRWVALSDQIWDIFESGQTTEFATLQTFTTLFQSVDQAGKVLLIYFMSDLINLSKERGGYGYPELFWLVLDSNLLFEFTDISDVGRLIGGFLCRTGGVQATRSYLIHTLLGTDTAKHANALLAFYATGHSLQSLGIVMEVAPEPNESNAQLYVFVYGDAVTFLLRNKTMTFADKDKAALTAFFTRGLSLSNAFVVAYCQQALMLLVEMS